MPLPDTDRPWPPTPANVANKISEWAAWWAGDAEELSRTYGGFTLNVLPRPGQREGIVSKAVRWFWGAPTAEGQQRTKLHVPVASDISTASADLLFGEQLDYTGDEAVPEESTSRLDTILDGNSFHSLLLEGAEACSGLGGVYLRTTWDETVADHPLSTIVHGDAGYPEFRWGRLSAVTFSQVVRRENNRVWRWLERHEPGVILHGLYVGTEDKLGRVIPLEDSPVTAPLATQVDARGGIATGHPRLTAAYVPNMRPNPLWRSDPQTAMLGRSDYARVEPLFDAVDETMTSWMRDVRLAKGRIIVPTSMLEPGRLGGARTFNLDQEVFAGLNMMLADEAPVAQQLTVQQFAIRAAEHEQTMSNLLQAAYRSAGYSAATFGVADEGGAMTATEVSAREKRSHGTREKKTRYWSDALREHLAALVAVDREVFGGPEVWQPRVEFPASAQPTQSELASSLQMLNAAQAVSTFTRVKMLHPDWTDEQVSAEVTLILDETAPAPALDPFGDADVPPELQ